MCTIFSAKAETGTPPLMQVPNINFALFSGFAKNANLQKAKLQLLQTQNQVDNLKLSIDNDVLQSQNLFRVAITTMDFQKKNMALAESVYDQTKKKYELDWPRVLK